MPTLRSGFVLSAGYAAKLRKTLFAQLKDLVKQDKEFASKIAYYSGLLNRALFTLLVEELKVDKLDVVRISINYDVDEANKAIIWKWDTLKIEIYKRVSPETYESTLKNFILKAPELALKAVKYSVNKLGESFDGDIVYEIRIGEKEVGAAVVYPIDENTIVLKVAAVIEPTAAVFEKSKLELAGRSIEEVLLEKIGKIMEIAKHISHEEAFKIVNAIREKVKAKPMEKIPEIEIEGGEFN
ncbi:MAG: DUF2258 domain-containing protein [Desulfurococcaceae archaeon]